MASMKAAEPCILKMAGRNMWEPLLKGKRKERVPSMTKREMLLQREFLKMGCLWSN